MKKDGRGNLVVSRYPRESVVINGNIVVTVVKVDGDKVRLGISAPREVPVHREELLEKGRRS